jgi:hypothetical protein
MNLLRTSFMKKSGKRVKRRIKATRTRGILRSTSPKRNLSIRKRKGGKKEVNIIDNAIL